MMSAFAGGCSSRLQSAFKTPRTAHFFLSKNYQKPRFFSLRAAKKVRPSQPSFKKDVSKNKSSSSPTKFPITARATPVPAAPIIYKSYATRLAEKAHVTHLYEAPSHTVYMLICYSTAGFCFMYSTISFWSNYMHAPPNLATWVPIALGGVSFMMACLGGWVVLGPSRLVKSLVAVPRSAKMVNGSLVKPGGPGPELQIEVELKKMLPVPFLPVRKFYVKPEEIELPHRFSPVSKKVSVEESRARDRLEQDAIRRELAYERSHILTSPFRKMSKLTFMMFTDIKRAWTREGMMKVGIKGQNYKLDISSGWALEGGRALDTLVKIKS